MNVALLVVLAIYVAGAARILIAWQRARHHYFNLRVRPFDPGGSVHDGCIQVSSEDEPAEGIGPYRESARPATDGSRDFAIRCDLLLARGPADKQFGLRRWDVIERTVERHDFGLRVSTREVIPVVLENVDDQVEIDLTPRGSTDGKLRCVAELANGDQVSIEGSIEHDARGRHLVARRITPDRAPLPDVNAVSRTSQQALYWSVWMGIIAGGIVAAYISPAMLVLLIVGAIVAFVGVASVSPTAAGMMVAVVWVMIRGEDVPAADTRSTPITTYTAKDIVQLPLDVDVPTTQQQRPHKSRLRR